MDLVNFLKIIIKYIFQLPKMIIAKYLAKYSARANVEDKLVVFISDLPRAREAKLAYGLKNLGWIVILICNKKPNYDLKLYFNKYVLFNDRLDVVIKASKFNPVAYHIFSNGNYNIASSLIKFKPGKVILDSYDNIGGFISEKYLEKTPSLNVQIKLERYCLENADGLCCRNLETQYSKKVLKYNLTNNRIFFPEYCWGNIKLNKKLSEKDGMLHVVYGGSIWLEKENPGADFGFLWLIDILSKNKINFHLYPSPSEMNENFSERYEDYIYLNKINKYFHLHTPADPKQWIIEQSKYDIGVCLYQSQLLGKPSLQYTVQQQLFNYSNGAVADFIDASVYLIANKQNLVYRLSNRLGLASPLHEIDELYSDEFWETIKHRLKKSRNKFKLAKSIWSIDRQSKRLSEFYDKLKQV